LGCTGAAAFIGTGPSTHLIPGGWQASWPMLAVYQSTSAAPFAAAWSASIWFSSFCFSRSHATSPSATGICGQQPGPLSGKIAG
jgi:hypothetical protein